MTKITRKIETYRPDHAAIAAQSGGLLNVIDAQFDHPGYTIAWPEADGPLPAGVELPSRCDPSFPHLASCIRATHHLSESGLVPLHPRETWHIGRRGYGSIDDHLVHVDADGQCWALLEANHYDEARATVIEICVVDPAEYTAAIVDMLDNLWVTAPTNGAA